MSAPVFSAVGWIDSAQNAVFASSRKLAWDCAKSTTFPRAASARIDARWPGPWTITGRPMLSESAQET